MEARWPGGGGSELEGIMKVSISIDQTSAKCSLVLAWGWTESHLFLEPYRRHPNAGSEAAGGARYARPQLNERTSKVLTAQRLRPVITPRDQSAPPRLIVPGGGA